MSTLVVIYTLPSSHKLVPTNAPNSTSHHHKTEHNPQQITTNPTHENRNMSHNWLWQKTKVLISLNNSSLETNFPSTRFHSGAPTYESTFSLPSHRTEENITTTKHITTLCHKDRSRNPLSLLSTPWSDPYELILILFYFCWHTCVAEKKCEQKRSPKHL
jgi:hypothetical protein